MMKNGCTVFSVTKGLFPWLANALASVSDKGPGGLQV